MSCRPQVVYVAGPWAERDRAAEVAAQLEAKGHTIAHDWWNYDGTGEDKESQEFLAQCAETDAKAVLDSDVFLLLNTQKRGEETSGKAVEFGLALAMERQYGPGFMRIIGTGIRGTNLFQLLPSIEWFEKVEDAIAVI